jgi:hypothetical protein
MLISGLGPIFSSWFFISTESILKSLSHVSFNLLLSTRVFQLRKKASRSPLEIIAMKHSMEERQYMLEETQRAIRREEKQKKMFQNKLLRQTIEQLSPPKQMEHVSPILRSQLKQLNMVYIDVLAQV